MVYHLPSLKKAPYLMPSDPRPLVEVLGFLPMAEVAEATEAQPEQPEKHAPDKSPDLQAKTDLK